MYVNLNKLPDPNKEYATELSKLDGGLNIAELPYRLKNNESPDMINLWWRDGALCCRDGQTRLTGDEGPGVGYSAYEGTFHGYGFFHAGEGLYAVDLSDPGAEAGSLPITTIREGVPEAAGTWFRFGEKLYYKCPGAYIEISYDPEGDTEPDLLDIFVARDVPAYEPIIQINTDPDTCAGDSYQPENRISPVKTVWYTAKEGVEVYRLPVTGADRVDKVVVDGVELAEGTGYTVDLTAGTVTFTTAPPAHDPVEVNTVKITYTKENAGGMSSIMDCSLAVVYGGDQDSCVVMGAPPAQPNAYFWSGNHTVMDPGYFPVEQYNLAGDASEYITGFGKQQSMLVILKERSVGRAEFGVTEMGSGRVLISMPYTPINARIGCDLPGSIQLIENNLVFANRSQGVFLIRDSSSAYENNIVGISGKINGEALKNGLLYELAGAARVTSFDDDSRYWLCADEKVYVWGYDMSTYADPSWFPLDGMKGVAYLMGDGAAYHLDGEGRVSILRRDWKDYGEAITKRYRFPAQHFGNYDQLKDVVRCVFTVRGDTDTVIRVVYDTDYGVRYDPTPVVSGTWRLAPRALGYRLLMVTRFAKIAVRRPGTRHVRHFTMELSNSIEGQDMCVIAAEICYKYQSRDR